MISILDVLKNNLVGQKINIKREHGKCDECVIVSINSIEETSYCDSYSESNLGYHINLTCQDKDETIEDFQIDIEDKCLLIEPPHFIPAENDHIMNDATFDGQYRLWQGYTYYWVSPREARQQRAGWIRYEPTNNQE